MIHLKAISDKKLYATLLGAFLLLLCFVVWKDKFWILILPILVSGIFLVFQRYQILYWLLIACIPISITQDFSSSLSTDFPTEFLCIILTCIFWVKWFIYRPQNLSFLWKSKISLGLFILWIWSGVCTISAIDHLIAFKYLLAKVWFITSYFCFTYWLIRTDADLKKLFWTLFLPLLLTVIYSFGRTALDGFNFEHTNQYSLPFYDNHVAYAVIMTLILPYVWIARSWYHPGSLVRWVLNICIPFLIIAIFYSYTRACYLALLIGIGSIFLLRCRKLIIVYIAFVIVTVAALFYMSRDYSYLKLAPDYNTTVMHNEFKDHFISTFYGKDASSMERLNMWVSVFRMYQERPILGYGPNNFSSNYKPYSVMYFRTWVSDNPLRLSCHNYFWLLLAEQGLVGLILFVIFLGYLLYWMQNLYHQYESHFSRQWIQASLVSIVSFIVVLFFNDLVESAKSGSIFLILLSTLVIIHKLNMENEI